MTSKLIYSQQTYPRTIKLGNDTVVVLLPDQVKKINIVWEHKRFLESENSILNNTLNEYTILSQQKDSLIKIKTNEMNSFITETMRLTQDNVDLTNKNKELNLHLTKAKKGRKIWFLGGVAVGILTTALIN